MNRVKNIPVFCTIVLAMPTMLALAYMATVAIMFHQGFIHGRTILPDRNPDDSD